MIVDGLLDENAVDRQTNVDATTNAATVLPVQQTVTGTSSGISFHRCVDKDCGERNSVIRRPNHVSVRGSRLGEDQLLTPAKCYAVERLVFQSARHVHARQVLQR